MSEFGLFRVVGHRTYRGHELGTEFEMPVNLRGYAVSRAIQRGDIEFLGPVVPELQPGSFTFPEGWLASPHPQTTEAPRGASLIGGGK